jgi:hypothetical protein
MAITLSIDSAESLDIDTFVREVDANLDLRDPAGSLEACAPSFRALMNNRRLITDTLNRELDAWSTFQPSNTYTGQTLILARGDLFAIRANAWLPLTRETMQEWEAIMFAYDLPHDHNFTFMTGGYFGAGYRTQIYEYDRTTVRTGHDERIDLELLEDTTLPQGKVMIYRESTDVHLQHPAEAFSVSLNVMIPSLDRHLEQYTFDLENKKIVSPLMTLNDVGVGICTLAGYLGDGETVNHLERLVNTSSVPLIRHKGLEAMARIDPSRVDDIVVVAEQDPDAAVRARQAQIRAAAMSSN